MQTFLVVFAIGFIFGSFASMYGLLLEKNYRLNVRLYSMILGATVNFLLIYLTIGKYGIIGLSISTMIGYFFVFVVNYLYTDKIYKPLLLNKELLISIIIITVFIVFYKDVWFFNLFFLVLSVLVLGMMILIFKKIIKMQNTDFFNQGKLND